MLDELEPQEFVDRLAAKKVIPLDDGWQQTGVIAASAHNNFERYLAVKTHAKQIDASRWRKPDNFIPKFLVVRRESLRVDQASIDTYQALMESRYAR